MWQSQSRSPLFLPAWLWFRYSKHRVNQHSTRGPQTADRIAPSDICADAPFPSSRRGLCRHYSHRAPRPRARRIEATLLVDADTGKVLHAENATDAVVSGLDHQADDRSM